MIRRMFLGLVLLGSVLTAACSQGHATPSPTPDPASITVSTSLVVGPAPAAVLLTATLPDDMPRELHQASCYGHRWDLGGTFEQGYNDLVVCPWPPAAPVRRSFQTIHVFSEPGTYDIVFELGRRGASHVSAFPLTIVVPMSRPEDPVPGMMMPPRLDEPHLWAGKYKLALDDNVFVYFTYPETIVDWLQQATVYHVPSGARGSVTLLVDGPGNHQAKAHVRQDIGTPEGRAIVEDYLEDQEFVNALAVRISEIWSRR